ncbi:MAG: hypothetical protein CMN27_09380 [Salinisphaera sp.]|nr:hypothetical protein [Salinisphaera sp.]
MPNPKHRPMPSYYPLVDDRWRIALESVPTSYEYAVRLQRRVDEGWKTAGPTGRGRSVADALGKLVRGYRMLADEIEAAYLFEGVAAIDDGCPKCGYAHPDISARRDGQAHLRCAICRVSLWR